jgi:hypothetical protein
MKRLFQWVLLASLAVVSPGGWAHSISFLKGELVVHQDKLEIKLDVRSEDILLSGGTSFIVVDQVPRRDVLSGVEAHRKFLLEGIRIDDAEGQRLTGRITKVEIPPLPAGAILLSNLMATNFTYHLEYPLAKPPARLAFQQQFDISRTATPVVMELRVVRAGQTNGLTIPIPMGDTPEFVAIDWSDESLPPVAAAPPLDPVEAFLYIQDDEVRVEILVPLRTLESWQPLPRAYPGVLEVAEQDAAKPALEKWFAEFNELRIDGVLVRPRLDRLDYYGVDFQDLAARLKPKRLSVGSARVGAILSYSTKGAARQVDLKWTLFNDRVTSARPVVFAYDQGRRIELSESKPTFTWNNPGRPPLPKIESVTSKTKMADDAARSTLAETLVRNVYRGFDYRNESDIYDALAQSVQGDLLTELYLKIKLGLTIQEQGGAVARVREVKVVKCEPLPNPVKDGFAVRVTWQVEGTVEHWGHVHTRVNEYTADLGIAKSGGAWKIVSMNVTRQNQVQSVMSVRKL